MKNLSNTSIAAIFAVGLTLLVALFLEIPYFADKEAQTTDEMMLLRYQLHNKYSPFKPDSHLVIAAIDQKSLDMMGRWPFPREDHGVFLSLLAAEKPKTVGWDILFTEAEAVSKISPPPAASATPAPAPVDSSSVPNVSPASTSPAPTPESQPAPTAPAPADTNAAPSSPTPAPTTDKPSAKISSQFLMPVGATPSNEKSTSTAPETPDTALPQNPSDPALNPDDQQFVQGAALFPNMITGAEQSTYPQPPLDDQAILPTRALTHINGDTSKIFASPYAELPFPALRKESYFGFVNQVGSSGGGIRNTDPMLVNVAGKFYPAFDLQVLLQFWGVDPDKVVVNLGHEIIMPKTDGTQVRIPIDAMGQININYRGRLEDFQRMSYAQMIKGLNDKANGDKSEDRDHLPVLKDNIVILGVTFSGTDSGPTPLDNEAPAPLVVTHLNALSNILQQDFLKPVSAWIWMPLYALFLFGTGALMLRVGIAPMIPIGLVALVVLAGVGFAALYFGNYLMPVAMPEIGILLLAGAVPTKRFFGEEREKLRVRSAMRAYLSDKVMTKILAHPDGVKLGGVKQVITIMFCDIRGFTAYCDNRDPQEVLNVVNEYFEEMTQVVFKYDGTVDKYIGDCIMAFWNQPDLQADHAQRAVCCAMEMRYALANFKVKRAGLDTELFECGIGIHTGEALVGNMGSSLKINYTAMGSAVNLAARLESLTKKLNERILISQATLDALTGEFPITDRGEAIVPGFADPIHVYGVGAEQDLSSALKIGVKLAQKQDYTAEEVTKPIWAPAPLPEDADPNP